MKIDFQDIGAFIENIIEDAESRGIKIYSVASLLDYLEDNPTSYFTIKREN